MADHIRTNENGKVWVKPGQTEDKYLRNGEISDSKQLSQKRDPVEWTYGENQMKKCVWEGGWREMSI